MLKPQYMPNLKVTDEERKLIEDAIEAGKVNVVRPGAAKNDEMTRSTKELASERRKEFNRKKKASDK